MADDVYVIDQLASNGASFTVTDDGSGNDWLIFAGIFAERTDVKLSWAYDASGSYQASGFYFDGDNVGSRLVVEGFIENVRGSNGSDFIQGNEGANILFGDNAEAGSGMADVIWGGEGNDTIYGGAGSDEIGGDEDDDRLFGNAGKDTIDGGSGVDLVEGGAGADVLSGGSDSGDTVSYAASAGAVRVGITYGSSTVGRGGDAAGDRIGGFTDVVGSAKGDTITDTVSETLAFGYNDNRFVGGAGNDTLLLGGGADAGLGGQGNDKLTGGLGGDDLTGGAGSDTFVYKSSDDSTVASADRDVIVDFRHGQGDRIDLEAIDALAGRGNQAFDFIGTDGFTGDGGELRLNQVGKGVIVYGDIDGDRRPDFAVLVENVKSLVESDFLL